LENTKNFTLTQENEFLMKNIFSSTGNYYPICNSCLRDKKNFKKIKMFSSKRLTRLRKIKQAKDNFFLETHGLISKKSNNSKSEERTNNFKIFRKQFNSKW
jgi:hypothetical protein